MTDVQISVALAMCQTRWVVRLTLTIGAYLIPRAERDPSPIQRSAPI